jgi:nucleotide-binding universal stress UspA family protein
MYSQIVVPLDGSEESARALPHAVELARAGSATLHLLMVVSRSEEIEFMRGAGESYLTAEYSRDMARDLIAARIKHAEDYLKEVASSLESQGVKVQTAVREGAAVENIVAHSREQQADLIVMCTRGRGGIQRLLVGSTTDRVIRSGGVPVLAIPPED